MPVLLAQIESMQIARLLDEHFPTYGNWQGLPLTMTGVSGQQADDPLYVPEIKRLQDSLACQGVAYMDDKGLIVVLTAKVNK